MQPISKRRISPKVRREEAFQAAWEELVRRYGVILRGQVRRSLHGAGFPFEPEQVEERVQEVYYRLLTGGAGRLRLLRRWSERQVVAYLSKVAQRVVVDEVRAQAAAKRGGLRLSFAACLGEAAERAVDPCGSPEERVMVAEARRLLLERCRRLAGSMGARHDRELCLRILRLAFLEGWTSREIACAEGGRLVVSTVDSLVHRARRRLARGGFEVPSRRRTGR
jgi:DNA-directed RNA polymerase specialized sigma24 family protein